MQYDQPQHDPYDQGDMIDDRPEARTNTLGVVGLVLSFCISPVGLLVSLVALSRRPRGFAVAGVIVGLVGTIVWGIGALLAASAWAYGPAMFKTLGDFTVIQQRLTVYAANNNGAPAPDLTTAGVPGDALVDHWGTPYVFTPGASGTWTIQIAGPDRTLDTADDARLSGTMSQAEIGRAITPMIEAAGASRAAGSATQPAPAPSTSPDPADPAGAAPDAPPASSDPPPPQPPASQP
ncbi:MAG: DUF4190 domain-containing protein [Planctomycetota bacterium]|nr:DUF4190 domain-containing protein [Planctomycetota bacterium]